MMSLKPPSAATWLLSKFGHENDALSGDLLEEYGHERSVAWYWKQVLFAIVVDFRKNVRAHKLLTVRSIAVGWVASYFFNAAARPLLGIYHRVLVTHGLVVSGEWWSHYYQYPAFLVIGICAAASGWVVARLHREHSETMVLAYLFSVQIWNFPQFFRLAADVITNRRFLPYLLGWLAVFILLSVSILFGGLSCGSDNSHIHDLN